MQETGLFVDNKSHEKQEGRKRTLRDFKKKHNNAIWEP